MNNRITFEQIVARFEENDLPYGVLPLQNGALALVSQRGGRIFGPFLSESGASLSWTNGAFADPEAFRAFLESESWNLGGDRLWISPEIQYSVPDRSDFWGSIHLPEQVDPGQYTLEQTGPQQWRLSQAMTLKAYNLASGEKELALERLIQPAADPLRQLSRYSDLMDSTLYIGYEQIVTLSEGRHDDIMSEAWSLIQLNPGGDLYIPCTPRIEYTDYYEPIDATLQAILPGHVRLRITGDRQYKVGYKAAHVLGRLGYFYHHGDGQACLIVRNFFNNPSAPYTEEPHELPGCRGHSIHVYNDDGQLGGFGELECTAQTIGGETGRSTSTDHLVLWIYVGSVDRVREIGLYLLGIEF